MKSKKNSAKISRSDNLEYARWSEESQDGVHRLKGSFVHLNEDGRERFFAAQKFFFEMKLLKQKGENNNVECNYKDLSITLSGRKNCEAFINWTGKHCPELNLRFAENGIMYGWSVDALRRNATPAEEKNSGGKKELSKSPAIAQLSRKTQKSVGESPEKILNYWQEFTSAPSEKSLSNSANPSAKKTR